MSEGLKIVGGASSKGWAKILGGGYVPCPHASDILATMFLNFVFSYKDGKKLTLFEFVFCQTNLIHISRFPIVNYILSKYLVKL